MQPAQEQSIQQIPSPSSIRVFSPPLSPPPTSPLPQVPSERYSPAVIQNRTLRMQTSLPEFGIGRRTLNKSNPSSRYQIFRARRPEWLYDGDQHPFKSSSRTHLSSLTNYPQPDDEKNASDSVQQSASPPEDVTYFATSLSKSDVAISMPPASLGLSRASRTSERDGKANRTRNPPRRAIARSALYIPLTSGHKSSQKSKTTLQENESITSLPRLPSRDDLGHLLAQDPHVNSDAGILHRRISSRTYFSGKAVTKHDRSDVMVERKLTILNPRQTGQSNQTTCRAIVPTSDLASEEILPASADKQAKDQASTVTSREKDDTCPTEKSEAVIPQHGQYQCWYSRRRRVFWMLLTASFILVATAGILGGVLWRLSTK